MNANEPPKVVSAPIRMSPELMEKVAEAVARTGQKQAEILRLCLEIGLEDLRSCKYDLPKLVADTARALRIYAPDDNADSEVTELPFFGSVAAGIPAAPLDVMDGTHPVPGKYDPGVYYVLRVHGQSMEPEYLDGSLLLCRKLKLGEYAKKGDDVIACDSNGSYFKHLIYTKDPWQGQHPRKAVPRLVSINPKFAEVIPVSDCPIVAIVEKKL